MKIIVKRDAEGFWAWDGDIPTPLGRGNSKSVAIEDFLSQLAAAQKREFDEAKRQAAALLGIAP